MMSADAGEGGDGTAPAGEPARTRFSEKVNRGERGLAREVCGCRDPRVVYTRPTRGGRIMRRRECRRRKRRVTTWEKVGCGADAG